MVDARVVFIALIVLFTLIIGSWTFTLFTGGFVKPLIDNLSPGDNDAINSTEYLRISDRLYSTHRIVFFSAIAIVIIGLFLYLIYSRQESTVGGFG